MVAKSTLLSHKSSKSKKKKSEELDNETLEQGGEAAAYLGLMYLRGEGAKQSNSSALEWFIQGADVQNPYCLALYGIMVYEMESSTQEEKKVALKNIENAAELGSAEAQTYLDQIYYGEGKFTQAFKYFYKAFRSSDTIADIRITYS